MTFMPAGGEGAIGDGGALMGQRPDDEVRAEIWAEARKRITRNTYGQREAAITLHVKGPSDDQ